MVQAAGRRLLSAGTSITSVQYYEVSLTEERVRDNFFQGSWEDFGHCIGFLRMHIRKIHLESISGVNFQSSFANCLQFRAVQIFHNIGPRKRCSSLWEEVGRLFRAGFLPPPPSPIDPSPGSLSLVQSRGLCLGASCAPLPFCLLVLTQGSGSCLRTTPFWSWQDPPAPVRVVGFYTHSSLGRRRKAARQRAGKEFGSVTDSAPDRGPCPNWMNICSYQRQVLNYRPTAINLQLVNFGGWGCWEHQNVWTLWCRRLWPMLFGQHVLAAEREFVHSSAEVTTRWSNILQLNFAKGTPFLNDYYAFAGFDILWGTS